MKKCAVCGKSKSDTSYRKDGRYRDNLSAICEGCRSDKELSDAAALTRILSEVEGRDRLSLISRVFGALPTVDIDGVAILAAGGPYFGTGSPPEGDFFSKADLEEIADGTNKLEQAGELRPPSKLGHSEEQRLLNNSGLPVGDELPAAGWLTNFRVEKLSGVWKLLADVKQVPAKLGQILASGGYRTRSVELSSVTRQDGSGEQIDNVVTGLAWLGAKAPAVRSLDDVWNLYAAGDVVWEEEDGIMDLLSDLTMAINQEIAPDEPSYMWELWVNDVNLALNKCTASDWDSDTTWIIGFSIGSDNEPTVDARDMWVPSTMKLVEVDPADADPLGGGAPMADLDDEYAEAAKQCEIKTGLSSGARYSRLRQIAHARFVSETADTKDVDKKDKQPVKLSDDQVVALAKTFEIEGDGTELRAKVEDHLKTFAAETPTPPAPTPPAPTPEPPTPAEPTLIRLSSFSAEQRAELTPLLETLTERAERGDRAYAQHFAEARDGKIQKAIESGRLNPSDRDQWAAFYNAQPDLASKQLEALPVNPALIVTFGVDDDGLTAEQATSRNKEIEDAYLAATGAAIETPGGNS